MNECNMRDRLKEKSEIANPLCTITKQGEIQHVPVESTGASTGAGHCTRVQQRALMNSNGAFTHSHCHTI